MATLHLTATTTVADLRKEFNEAFGAQVKVYIGNKIAEQTTKLSDVGLINSGEFECRSSLTVASFMERMKNEFGLKVKVYTCDEWVAVLDGLTLESAGKVKKNAVKADMESMLAYQRTQENDAVPTSNTPSAPVEDNTAIEAAKLASEKAKADAEAAKAKAEAEAAKAAAEKAQAEAAAIAAAKLAADKAKAELEKQKAEAEAAKAELARIQAEAAKAKAEAEAAKAAAEKARAETEKAAASTPATPAKTSNNKGALNGLFSVADNKKVRFSMGNLQFNAKKYEFRFAEHQYDRIGDDNTKISSNYDGWIDLFGYGTSGYMGCEPFETNTENEYPDQDIANTNYDWGVYNPISNGGNKEGLWRTLTRNEWDYLFYTRPNAAKLCARACVNGINGLLLLPDDFYEHRVRIPFDSTPAGFSGNKYDLTQWTTLQDAGAVFLPCNGKRKGTSMTESVGSYGSYWSSKYYGTIGQKEEAFYAYMGNIIGSGYGISYFVECYYGRGVRLVQDVK